MARSRPSLVFHLSCPARCFASTPTGVDRARHAPRPFSEQLQGCPDELQSRPPRRSLHPRQQMAGSAHQPGVHTLPAIPLRLRQEHRRPPLALDALEAMFDQRADTFCLVTKSDWEEGHLEAWTSSAENKE